MFESMTDRIAGTVLMGLDVAVEFATLGEFRLVEADASPAPYDFQAAPLVRRPARLATPQLDPKLLPPASTAIARLAAASAERAAARRGIPRPQFKAGEKAVIPSAPRRRPPASRITASKAAGRKRAGAVERSDQLCLFSR
jgi:hypothetical protein